MAKPWSSCLENEFYEDFKVTFSKEQIIFNEQTCILMMVQIDNLQSSDRKENRDYAEAVYSGPMSSINDYITQAKKALDRITSPYTDANNRNTLMSIIG